MPTTKTGGTWSKWTICDIAREAGVSAKTVSLVLNNKAGVGPEKRAEILQIIKQVGYRPHMGARTLRGKGSGSIGVTLPAPPGEAPLNQTLILWLFEELYKIFGSHGEYVSFDMNPYAGDLDADYARGLWEQLYKAVLLIGPLAQDDKTIARVHASGAPYLAMSRLDSLPEISCAAIDYEEGAYLSTKFLIGRGHTRIGILKALPGYHACLERRRGYLKALEEAGIAPDESLMRAVRFDSHNIASMVHRILDNHSVTAVVDSSGAEDALSLREGARRAGRVAGKDFEIVSWTYADNAAVLAEACAHVWLPVREAGTDGVEQLAKWVYGEQEGPVRVLYRPVLHEHVDGAEIPRPKRLFEMLG